MRRIKINSLWKPSFIAARDKEGRFGIYSEVVLEKILQYERSRADREGGYFSVVLFKLEGNDASNDRLVTILKNSTRLIDHVGWYEKDIVCVVLTATDIDGAKLFAEKIATTVETEYQNGKRPLYSYDLFRYPDIHDGEGHHDVFTIYKGNKLRINEELMSSFVMTMPGWKRYLDVFGSMMGLLLLSPLFLSLALYIKLVSKGPVFYKQTRVGYKGRDFTFIKFRTMHQDNDENFHSHHASDFISKMDVPMEKLDDRDPRIIPGGKIMRKACVDELPQLFNVLRGDMSLVGPRPCIPYEAEEYLRWHAQRFDVMPGMTGLWQVSGKNKLTFHQMISLDIAYSRKLTLWNDLRIILRTPPAILGMVSESVAGKLGLEHKKAYV